MLGATLTVSNDIQEKDINIRRFSECKFFFSWATWISCTLNLWMLRVTVHVYWDLVCHLPIIMLLKSDNSKNYELAVYLQVYSNTGEEVRSSCDCASWTFKNLWAWSQNIWIRCTGLKIPVINKLKYSGGK